MQQRFHHINLQSTSHGCRRAVWAPQGALSPSPVPGNVKGVLSVTRYNRSQLRDVPGVSERCMRQVQQVLNQQTMFNRNFQLDLRMDGVAWGRSSSGRHLQGHK
jgi:hypothetical protein